MFNRVSPVEIYWTYQRLAHLGQQGDCDTGLYSQRTYAQREG